VAPWFRLGEFNVGFYANDRGERAHVHVIRGRGRAKLWLDSLVISQASGFAERDLNRIARLVEEHLETLRRSWDEYFP
jgi:Domain of unknown function (DUF4160)